MKWASCLDEITKCNKVLLLCIRGLSIGRLDPLFFFSSFVVHRYLLFCIFSRWRRRKKRIFYVSVIDSRLMADCCCCWPETSLAPRWVESKIVQLGRMKERKEPSKKKLLRSCGTRCTYTIHPTTTTTTPPPPPFTFALSLSTA